MRVSGHATHVQPACSTGTHLVHLSVTDAKNTLVTRLDSRRASFHGNAKAPMTWTTHLANVTFMR